MYSGSFAQFLRSTVVAAGQLLKTLVDLHTSVEREIDVQVNSLIVDAISRAYPTHRWVSEECDRAYCADSEPTWIIDPVDGSENLYRGLLAYTVSISLVQDGDILLGAVYEPYVERLYFAERGKGATVNGRNIRVSDVSRSEKLVVALSRPRAFGGVIPLGEAIFQQLVAAYDVRITASTALDMCCVAGGALEARVSANARCWDTSAATLVVREAGGMVSDWQGNERNWESKMLLASNGLCHSALLDFLASAGR